MLGVGTDRVGTSTVAGVPVGTAVTLAPPGADGSGLPLPVRRRLAEFGVRTGATVTVLSRAVGGGRVLAVGTARVAVDGATAGRLVVEAPTCP